MLIIGGASTGSSSWTAHLENLVFRVSRFLFVKVTRNIICIIIIQAINLDHDLASQSDQSELLLLFFVSPLE